MVRLALMLVFSCLSLGAPISAMAANPKLAIRDKPPVYYPVKADTIAEAKAILFGTGGAKPDELGLASMMTKASFDTESLRSFRPTVIQDPNDPTMALVSFSANTVQMNIQFVLPKFTDPSVRACFSDWYDSVLAHENQHRDIFIDEAKNFFATEGSFDIGVPLAEYNAQAAQGTAAQYLVDVLKSEVLNQAQVEFQEASDLLDQDTDHGAEAIPLIPKNDCDQQCPWRFEAGGTVMKGNGAVGGHGGLPSLVLFAMDPAQLVFNFNQHDKYGSPLILEDGGSSNAGVAGFSRTDATTRTMGAKCKADGQSEDDGVISFYRTVNQFTEDMAGSGASPLATGFAVERPYCPEDSRTYVDENGERYSRTLRQAREQAGSGPRLSLCPSTSAPIIDLSRDDDGFYIGNITGTMEERTTDMGCPAIVPFQLTFRAAGTLHQADYQMAGMLGTLAGMPEMGGATLPNDAQQKMSRTLFADRPKTDKTFCFAGGGMDDMPDWPALIPNTQK